MRNINTRTPSRSRNFEHAIRKALADQYQQPIMLEITTQKFGFKVKAIVGEVEASCKVMDFTDPKAVIETLNEGLA